MVGTSGISPRRQGAPTDAAKRAPRRDSSSAPWSDRCRRATRQRLGTNRGPGSPNGGHQGSPNGGHLWSLVKTWWSWWWSGWVGGVHVNEIIVKYSYYQWRTNDWDNGLANVKCCWPWFLMTIVVINNGCGWVMMRLIMMVVQDGDLMAMVCYDAIIVIGYVPVNGCWMVRLMVVHQQFITSIDVPYAYVKYTSRNCSHISRYQ